ncbi:transcription factor TFIIIB subunit brf1 [Exophiala oligosperma]
MPTLKPPPPKPRAGQHRRAIPRGRIEGLGSPGPVSSIRATTPSFRRASTPSIQRPVGGKVLKCTNPTCPNPHIVESEQGLICDTCGAVALEESGLVSEQGFGETDSGAITALGVRVNENQTHQRTYAPGGALGNAGREPTINRERSEQQARTIMQSYQTLLGVRQAEVDAGLQLFKLAWGYSFVQGRTIDSVAVVCLYLACRRKHEQIQNERRPMYSLMLIDFAEKLNIDVFFLGKMYSDLVRKLYLQSDGSIKGDVSSDLLAMGPEVLVNRFVDELEFDKAHRDKIKMDAIRIVQRMKRDWMSTGRRPSGVCGAAVILAARMNNYRRTTREVVLTAKVTEITINKRLEEFQDTASSRLSVSQFRDNTVLDAQIASDPPAYQRAHNPKPLKKKRGRPRKIPPPEATAEPETGSSVVQETGDGGPPLKRARVDADGYKIPDIPQRPTPIDPALTRTDAGAPAAGPTSDEDPARAPEVRRRKRTFVVPPPSEAELAIESEIEQDIQLAFRDNPELAPNRVQNNDTRPADADRPTPAPLPLPDDGGDALNPLGPHRKDKTPGPRVDSDAGNTGCVSLSPTIRPEEFDSDEDVSMCLLSEEESTIKETIWLAMNGDWIRKNHYKQIKQQLKDDELRARGLDPAKEALKEKLAKGRRKDGTKKPGRRGDVSYLDEQAKAEPGRGDRERSAAESVRKMFKTRGVYSRRVNYDVLDSIYGITGGGDDDDASGESRSASRSQSVASDMPRDAREGSVASSVASTTLGPEGIFRGNSGTSGKNRTKASFAAERRERKRREQSSSQAPRDLREGSNVSDAVRSRSPSEAAPGVESHERVVVKRKREASGSSSEALLAAADEEGRDVETGRTVPRHQGHLSPPATQNPETAPSVGTSSDVPIIASSSSQGPQQQQQRTPPATQSQQGPSPVHADGGIPIVASTQSQGPPGVRVTSDIPAVGSSSVAVQKPRSPSSATTGPTTQVRTGTKGTTATVANHSSRIGRQEAEKTGDQDGSDDDEDEEDEEEDDDDEDLDDDDDDDEEDAGEDYVREIDDGDIDAAFDGRYGDDGDEDW